MKVICNMIFFCDFISSFRVCRASKMIHISYMSHFFRLLVLTYIINASSLYRADCSPGVILKALFDSPSRISRSESLVKKPFLEAFGGARRGGAPLRASSPAISPTPPWRANSSSATPSSPRGGRGGRHPRSSIASAQTISPRRPSPTCASWRRPRT